MDQKPVVGVISFQGDFRRHIDRVSELGFEAVGVRDLETLKRVQAVVLPGGESTTIGMLLDRFGLLSVLKEMVSDGVPVLGTCAGAILLAQTILLAHSSSDSRQPRIGALDAIIRRNAYGRQVESFEAPLRLEREGLAGRLGSLPTGVFIRAPIFEHIGPDVQVLLRREQHPVLVRQGSILAATFHPELTNDAAVHRYFLEDVCRFSSPMPRQTPDS